MPVVAPPSSPAPLLARQRNAILAVLLLSAAAAWLAVLQREGGDAHGTMAPHAGAAPALDLTMGMGPAAYLAMWVAMMAA